METIQKVDISKVNSNGLEGGLQIGQLFKLLKLRWPIIAGVTSIITLGAVLKALTDTPIYQSKFEILTQSVTLETRIISTTNPEALSNQEDLIGSSINEGKLRILRSPQILNPVLEELQISHPNLTYSDLFEGLSLTVSPKDPNILLVNFKNASKEIVEGASEELQESYIQYSIEDRQSNIVRGIDFVEDQLPVLRDRVGFLQDSLEDLRRNNNLIDPELQGEQLVEQLGLLQQEKIQIEIQLRESQENYDNFQKEVLMHGDMAVSSFLQNDSRYQQLRERLLELDTQIAEQSVLLKETSPEIQYLLQQQEQLSPIIQQESSRVQREVNSHIQDLTIRYSVLLDTINALNLQIKELSTLTRLYTDVQRELEISTTNLNDFLIKRETLKIEAAQQQAPWKVLTPPKPPSVSVASAKRNFILGNFLGLIIGSGIVIAMDKFNNIARNPTELKSILPFPVLGTIPYSQLLKEAKPTTFLNRFMSNEWLLTLNTDQEPMSVDLRVFNEAFRSLNVNLSLMTPDRNIQTLTVSSTSPKEGKSTVAINLAKASAVMGKRVLLVDADLRRPSLHKKLGLPNDYGLMDLIVSQASLDDFVQTSLISSNLFILTSGGTAPDPSIILASKKMSDLYQKAKDKFDLVIYDSPPLIGFADALLMAALTKNLLFVVGLGKATR